MASAIPSARQLQVVERPQSTLPKYMARRGSVLYFKRRIPSDVAQGFPEYREQVWKSLGTHLVEKAKVFLAVEVTEFDLKVASLRRANAVQRAGRQSELQPVGAYPLGHLPQAANTTTFEPVPEQDARPGRAPAKEGSPAMRLSGKERAGAQLPAAVPVTIEKKAERPMVLPGERLSMQHLFEDWKRNQTRHRTVNAVHTAVMEFRTVNGVLDVPDITKAHARAYRDHLIERQLSKGTVENRLGYLSTLVRHGMKELVEQLSINPFERIEVVGAQGLRKKKKRRAYELHELNTLFSSRLYTAGYRPDGQCVDAAYWAPLLGPFVGARIEEIAQLRIDDVQSINGVWCIRICNLDEDQQIKTDSSFRRVPLHEVVIKCGFLVYAAQMAQAGHERLFPTLTNDNANSIYSNALGKWYGRYLESIGLKDHRLDYHSFRYTFKQRCSLCGVDIEVRDALAGHWLGNNDSGRTYLQAENRQYPFPKLVDAISKLTYQELRLEHLYVDKPFEGVDVLR